MNMIARIDAEMRIQSYFPYTPLPRESFRVVSQFHATV